MTGADCQDALWSGGALGLGRDEEQQGFQQNRQGRAWQPGSIPSTQPAAEQPGGTGAAPGIRNLTEDRDRLRLHWDVGLQWLDVVHGWAGQGCGELETSPAAALLGQGLMAPGG